MANPSTAPSDGEHDQNVVYFKWRFSVGASGVLTNVNTKGMKKATRNSAGSYTFNLAGTYPGGMLEYGTGIIGAYTTAGGTVGVVTVDNSKNATTPAITLVFYAVGTQTATEVDSGVSFTFAFALKNGLV